MQGEIQERQDRRILSAILSAGTEYVPLTMLLRICSTFAARVLEFQRGSRSVRSNEPFEPAERPLPFIAISPPPDTLLTYVSTAKEETLLIFIACQVKSRPPLGHG